ncbi:MAG TPA: hypothetical protein DCL54_14950 [Alphaproteobacteria bacterium]|nr:hypothetical protein [Alphaproteobacteria bacterium]HAJ47870.1 hypothetical protein [Alphaproteobacteria bacterium]
MQWLALRALLTAALALALSALDPFGISTRTEQISEDVFYQVYAPLVQGRVSPEPVVVRVTPESLDRLSEVTKERWAWPLTHGQQAKLLNALVGMEPKAVFFDFVFGTVREGHDEFMRAISGAIGPGYALPRDCTGRRAPDYQGLRIFVAQSSPNAKPYAGLCESGAEPVAIGWQGLGSKYPLSVAYGADTELPAILPTAAVALWEAMCSSEAIRGKPGGAQICAPHDPNTAFSVVWSTGVSPQQGNVAPIEKQCFVTPSNPVERTQRFWEQIHVGLLKAVRLVPLDKGRFACISPFTLTIDQVILANPGRDRDIHALIQSRIEGNAVLIGLDFGGLGDVIVSPVHGTIPGVMLHAHALENLLRYDTNTLVRRPESSLFLSAQAALVNGLVMVLGIGLFFGATSRIRAAERDGTGLTASVAWSDVVFGLIAWVVIILIAFGAAFFAFETLRLPPSYWLTGWIAVFLGTADTFGKAVISAVMVTVRGPVPPDDYEDDA